MITIREISGDPARDIVEGIVKLPTLRTFPFRERTLRPITNGVLKSCILASAKSLIPAMVKLGLCSEPVFTPPLTDKECERLIRLPLLPANIGLTANGQASQPPVTQAIVAEQTSNPAPQRGHSHCAILLFLFISLSAFGGEGRGEVASIKTHDAINAIVGEAAGQPFVVKLGVAEAIHNRGTLRGVYGFNAAHNRNEPAWVWRDAQRAWNQSEKTRITGGATHFGNRSDVAKGTFAGLKLTCVLGAGKDATYFFKRLA